MFTCEYLVKFVSHQVESFDDVDVAGPTRVVTGIQPPFCWRSVTPLRFGTRKPAGLFVGAAVSDLAACRGNHQGFTL